MVHNSVCNLFFSGRRVAYERALDIIQSEEYLNDSDFDEIRRYIEGAIKEFLVFVTGIKTQDSSGQGLGSLTQTARPGQLGLSISCPQNP